MFRSPDNDVDEGKQHGHPSPLTSCQPAKSEECAAQPRVLSDVVEDEQGGEHEGVGEYEESHDETEEYELLKRFRSLPDNDGAGAAKQHAKGEECAAQPGMLSEVVEDEDGGEHEDEGEHLKSHEGTEESELSPVVRHPEERSTFQNNPEVFD